MTGLGAPGGSTEGGEEEFEELRFSWDRTSWSSACKSAICFQASSKAARSRPHSGQEDTGVARDSLMDNHDTEMARNCKVLNNHWACGRKVDAKSRTGRLRIVIEVGTRCRPRTWMRRFFVSRQSYSIASCRLCCRERPPRTPAEPCFPGFSRAALQNP